MQAKRQQYCHIIIDLFHHNFICYILSAKRLNNYHRSDYVFTALFPEKWSVFLPLFATVLPAKPAISLLAASMLLSCTVYTKQQSIISLLHSLELARSLASLASKSSALLCEDLVLAQLGQTIERERERATEELA